MPGTKILVIEENCYMYAVQTAGNIKQSKNGN